MSLRWSIKLNSADGEGLVFTRISSEEAECNVCKPCIKLKLSDRSTKGLKVHLGKHPEYLAELERLEAKEKGQLEAQQRSMSLFVGQKDGLSSLDRRIMNFVAENNIPFLVIESSSFKNLFSSAEKGNVKGRESYTERVMPRVYKAVQKKIQAYLGDCNGLSFTTDIWSEYDSFISLTVHGIDSNWKRFKFVLCIRHFPGVHNFESIGRIVNEMLSEWNIERSKCHVFSAMRGSNMRKAFEEEGFKHANCGAHMLSLVTSSIKEDKSIKLVLEKCRRLVGHFTVSNLAMDRLHKEQIRENVAVHQLIQDVPTRWWTKYEMGERLLEQRSPISLYLARFNYQNLELSEDDWELLAKIVKLLEPLTSASKQMCRDSEMLSAQFPIARGLSRLINDVLEPELQEVRAILLGRLVQKFDVEHIKHIGLAIFLDPRFKNRYASNRDEFNLRVRKWLQEEFEEENTLGLPNSELASPPPKSKRADVNSFFSQLPHLYKDGDVDNSLQPGGVIAEVDSYMMKPCINIQDDPLMFWKVCQSDYPFLSRIARRYLSAPATSIASESTFSAARDVYDYKRTRLLPKNAEILIFLHQNLPLIDFEY